MNPLYFLLFCAPLAAAQPRAATDKCPAIAPLSADECPPKEAAMSDCVGYDCRFGCKPYNLEDHGIEDWFPIGTICEARPNHDKECDVDDDLNNCYGHTGEMDGDFYKVVQGGPKCPFLEFVEECPKTLFNTGELPKCHSDKCLCEGDYCRGKGSSPDFCGATNEKENCDGHAVYKVTSHFYMPREGCDVCGAPPPPLDESCPILKLIDEDTCDYVEDKDDLPLCNDPCLCVGAFCRAEDDYCGSSKKIRNCDDGGMSIYIVESNPERSESCGFCPAANSECPALVPLDECLPGNPAANDCATDDCIYGCKPDPDLGIAERDWYPIGTVCEVKAPSGKGECNTDRGLDNCLGHDGEMNGDFYKVVQGGKNCPFLEKAKSCPNDVDDLPPCEDPCLAENDYCVGTGPTAKSCGATDAEPQCGAKAVYLVTSDQDMPREGCGLQEVEDECPFPCPAANDQCPALEPLPAHECPPKEASMADCVGYDCRYGCQPYNLEDHGIEDWYDIGTICEVSSHPEGECGTSRSLDNCYGHDGDMNGDFYRVVQGGPGCPYLEYVDAERCPDDVSDLPRCEDKCLPEEGGYCRGSGSGKENCGASDAKPQCDGEAVYRVTSTIDMAREGCDDGPDDGPGFEFDDDGDNCPFPCPARNEECPALEPLPADECPPKEASMADCVGYDCKYSCKPKNLDDHGIEEWYPIGTVCEVSSHTGVGECGTSRGLDNCFGHTGEMDGDFYRVVQGGPDCPYLEEARCPNDVDDLSPCAAQCLSEGEVCRGTATEPSPESCGTIEGKCYKVTSTKFMPREGCDGSDAGDDSSDEDEADCPFPCPAANDACPALEPLPEDECLPGNPAATDCVGHDCIYGCKPKTIEEYGIEEYRPVGTICERKYPLSGDGEGECGTSKSLNNCLGHDGDKDGDFYRVVQGGPGCPYLEKATCPTDGAKANLPPCEDKCALSEGDVCRGSGESPELCGASEGECFLVTSDKFIDREGCDGPGGSSKKKSSNDKAGLIAGVAIACVALLLLLAAVTYCCCRRSSSPAKSRREAPPSPQISNPVVEKAPSRRPEPDEQLSFQGGELR